MLTKRKGQVYQQPEWKSTPKATLSPEIRDLAWAAGFIDGEGHIRWGEGETSPRIGAWQTSPELLYRLQEIFGGNITKPKNVNGHAWNVYGSRALGVMQTLYPFFSTKRKTEVKAVLAKAKGL